MAGTMSVPRPAAAFLGLCLLLGARSPVAEGFSSVEAIAFQDFMVWQCSRNEPARAAEFARLRNPPHTCNAQDAALVEQARKSDEYRAMNIRLARQMGALSRTQLSDVCRSALAVRC